MPSNLRSVRFENFLDPHVEPITPPKIAATRNGKSVPVENLPSRILPDIPATELTKMNNAEVAAVYFGFAHFRKRIIGLRKIPPPTPTTPDTNPIAPPVGNAIFKLGGVKFPFVSDSNLIISRNAAATRAITKSTPYIWLGIWIIPPMNARGMERSKNGAVSL